MADILEERRKAEESRQQAKEQEETTIAPATKGYPNKWQEGVHYSTNTGHDPNVARRLRQGSRK